MSDEITFADMDLAARALETRAKQLRQFADMTTVSEGSYGGRLRAEAMQCELLREKLLRMYWAEEEVTA